MKKEKLIVFVWMAIVIGMIIGGLLGLYIAGVRLNFEIVSGVIFGPIIGCLFTYLFFKWRKKRRGNIPEADERNLMLLKRYLMIVLYIVLFGSGAVLLILYAVGIHTIETGMLILILSLLYMVILIGALVTLKI